MSERWYNKDDFWADNGVMFARAMTCLVDPQMLNDDQWAVLSGRLGISQGDLSALFERAVVATMNHDEQCNIAAAEYAADPANVYGTPEHEAYLLECEREEGW